MKIAGLVLGLTVMLGGSAAFGYFSVRGTPSMRVFGEGMPMSVRNYSSGFVSAAEKRRRRSTATYYGSSSRRHYGGGYSSGK